MKTVWSSRYRWMGFDLPPMLLKIADRIKVIGVLTLFVSALSGQTPPDMNTSGTLLPGISTDQKYLDWRIPNNPAMPYLFLTATGGDGGKREFKVITTCTKEGGQGASASAWFKVGQDGLLPGGILRMVGGKKGADAHGGGVEGAGGGGGSGIVYLPPNVDQSDPRSWIILVAAGGGGGAAASTVCSGSAGMPGQESANGANGNGVENGDGGVDGKGGYSGGYGGGGGGWQYPGTGLPLIQDCYWQFSLNYEKSQVRTLGGWSFSGKVLDDQQIKISDYWEGGEGGCTVSLPTGSCNGGGRGFGGGGTGRGSGGGGGGYSGGGGGGLIGVSGGGGGGGGGSYVNAAYAVPFSTVIHKRGTTSNGQDGSIQYQFAATSPVVSCGIGLAAHKGQMVKILHTGDWTLQWQYDGNLVLYQAGVAKWASGTNNKGTDLYFQGDGNLVIRQNGAAIWASNTANDEKGGKGGRNLVLTSEGHLFILDQDNKSIWQPH